MAGIEYRYELKFELSKYTAELLKQQLRCLMSLDSHSVGCEYSYDIRSIYFDDVDSSAYYEKINGEEYRKKYRIRMYNNNDSYLILECKYKHENMTFKKSRSLSRKVVERILKGEYGRISSSHPFTQQFLAEAAARHLKPSVIVDYRRLAFTYPTSETRVTFDSHLRSGRYSDDFFNRDLNTISLFPDEQVVMEVKFNEFLPEHISDVLSSVPTLREAISKFALCRSVK